MTNKNLEDIFGNKKESGGLDDIFNKKEKKVVEEEKGYLSNLYSGIKESVSTRADEMSDLAGEYDRGEKSFAETTFQAGAKGISSMWDILGHATPKAIKEPLMETMGNIINSKPIQTIAESSPVQTIAELSPVEYLANKYVEWEDKNPDKVDNLNAFGEYLSVLPIEKAFSGAYKGTSKAVSKATSKITPTIKKGVGIITEKGGKISDFSASQFTGLDTKTIRNLIENPERVTKAQRQGLDRLTLASRVEEAIKGRIDSLSALGKEYDTIREAGGVVEIKSNPFAEVMNKYNIGFENGKIIKTKKTRLPLKSGDTKAIEEFGYLFGTEKQLTAEEFLNARKMLDEMAKWDTDKTDSSKIISKSLRKKYDKLGKEQIKGLKSLDESFSEEIRELNAIRKDYIDKKTGKLKDGALNKIANLGGVGKDKVLIRLEKIMPNIKEDINILKALEDIEHVRNNKVGTYTRGTIGGFTVSGGNPVGAVLGAILSTPEIAVPIIKNYGIANRVAKRSIDVIIRKMKSGVRLLKEEKEILNNAIKGYSDRFNKSIKDKLNKTGAGLSIKDVSRASGKQADDITTQIKKAQKKN